jgi:hypothetical protein
MVGSAFTTNPAPMTATVNDPVVAVGMPGGERLLIEAPGD